MADTCDFKECKSGKPARVMVTENAHDAAFNIRICATCAKAAGLKDGDEFLAERDADRINKAVRAAYR